ncbi:hypothetical protein PGUG_05902 [Meyerozyma guilliermondii ATCC 6260]|uniref:Decapping nuclease n=1 Tax=Meyerozyma guilliermondii (strain ATCC 6260 / CBS 566 / DSM 6381 / JCM 1539 / NBRC 10279 / NRRL Y-324) TaxID=294746 RepID=A5DRK1_PICGU|nr:uncharacterized protein PGUG_05902 [Meyerozyma guilliermondii ATCC 6260]EDK41805.2 hypothetical protein PGUG_05902 [Meyerozyma guilliermondii ATCC 6260]
MADQWENADAFLAHCCEHNEIDLKYVRSDSFYRLLRQCDWSEESLYEALYCSKTSSFEIEFDRSLARTWEMDERLFSKDYQSNTWSMRRYPLVLGKDHARYHSYSPNSREDDARRGTKYIALAKSERKGVKVQADIVASRSALVDLMLSGINGTKASAWIYAVNDQLFLEDDERSYSKKNRFFNPHAMTGLNFEELMTVRQEMVDNKFRFKWTKNDSEKYYSLVRHESSLNDSILVACEIDAVKPQKRRNVNPYSKERFGLSSPFKHLDRYVEIKARVYEKRHSGNLHSALIQCFLAGTPTLVVGIKDGLKLIAVMERNVKNSLGRLKLPKWFLDRWLIFLVRFIKGFILKKRNGNLQSFHFHVNGSKLVIRERETTRSEIEAALTSDFLKWREEHPQKGSEDESAEMVNSPEDELTGSVNPLSQVDELADLVSPLSLKDRCILS